MDKVNYFSRKEDISAQALNYMLQPTGFSEIDSVEVIPTAIMGTMSEVCKLKLKYKTHDGKCPDSIFIKYAKEAPSSQTQISYLYINSNEYKAYKFLMNNQQEIIPIIYFKFCENYNYTILMEDLSVGFKCMEQSLVLPYEVLQNGIMNIVKFHSKYMNHPGLQIFDDIKKRNESVRKFISSTFNQQFISLQAELIKSTIANFYQKLNLLDFSQTIFSHWNYLQLIAKLPPAHLADRYATGMTNLLKYQPTLTTLLHNDLRTQNMFFSEHNIKLVDWQIAYVGHPLYDAFCFLSNSLDASQYESTLKKLFDLYCSEFSRLTGVQFGNQVSDILQTAEAIQIDILYILARLAQGNSVQKIQDGISNPNSKFKFLETYLLVFYRILAFVGNYKQFL